MSKLLDDNALEQSMQGVKSYVDQKVNSLEDIAVLIKGDKGDQGPIGPKGEDGAIGPKGDKGDGIVLLNGLTGIWAGTQAQYDAIPASEIDQNIYYLIKPPVPYCVTFNSNEPRTITPKYTNTGVTLQYSLDAKTWINIASGATTSSAKTIYFRGQATGTKSLTAIGGQSNAWSFSGDSTNKLRVTGNLNYLICDNLGDNVAPIALASSCYHSMFYNCTSLITAPELPAITLGTECYGCMFYGCTSLSKAPELPASTLLHSCYASMFNGCTSLVNAPDLAASILADWCYYQMFYNCSNLNSVKIHAISNFTANSALNGMIGGVSSSGTLTCKTELTTAILPTPAGWTRVNF